jgi:hypothetical protein
VTLSSSEAKYVAISEAVKEIKSMYFLLRDIGIDVDLPILVKTALGTTLSEKALKRAQLKSNL